jgi:4-hydroxythreonine-4-phosphate dehydrogenase
VLSGGHTAQVVLDRLGVPLLELVAELEPGVVASRMPGRRQLVVTKAGAFGHDRTLLELLHPFPSPRPERTTP